MDDDIIIEEMNRDDLDEVVEIERASFPSPWTKGLFLQELDKEHSFNYVVRAGAKKVEGKEKGSDLVGYIVFWKAADEMHILDFAVHPGFRMRGIGRRLLNHSISVAKSEGCLRSFLEVRKGNAVGLGMYESFGFEVIGERKRYYKDGEDAIVMTRNLS